MRRSIRYRPLFRLTVALNLAALFLRIFAACGAGEKDGAERQNHFRNGFIYGGKIVELGLAEGEKALDLVEEKEGYRLLVGKSISSETPFPMEDGRQLYYTSGTIFRTEYRFLNADLTLSDKEAVPTMGMTISAQKVGGKLYEYRGEPHIYKASGGSDETRYAEYLDTAMYADGKELWRVPYNAYGDGFGRSLYGSQDDVSVVETDGKTVYQGILNKNVIFVDGNMIDAAEGVNPASGKTIPFCGIMKLGDTVYALIRGTGGKARLIPLSADMRELGKKGIQIKGDPTGGCASDGETGFFFSSTELYATDGKSSRKLADLARHGFVSDTRIRRILPLKDGRILVLGESHLVELSPIEGKTEPETIVLGIIQSAHENLPQKVLRFNRLSDEYTIATREYETPEELNKALLSGEVGLIASNDQLLLRNYAEKGLLLDLEESVPGIFVDDALYPNVVDALRLHGKAYYLPPTFQLKGYSLPAMDYPKDGVNTMAEFFGLIDWKGREMKKRLSKNEAFLSWGLRVDEWIDWETRTAHFDDGDFLSLLTFCGTFPDQEEAHTYNNAHADDSFPKLNQVQVYDVSSFDGYTDTDTGTGHTIFWLPSRVHQGPQMYAPWCVGIVKNEKYEDGAKDFMDFVFRRDLAEKCHVAGFWKYLVKDGGVNAEEIDGFSINKKENQLILYCEGMPRGEYQLQLAEEWIEKADEFTYWYDELLDILIEESNRYFRGEITAEKAAEYIQNRVSIYLAEQG